MPGGEDYFVVEAEAEGVGIGISPPGDAIGRMDLGHATPNDRLEARRP